MEHRYSPRHKINLKAILITHGGNQYLAQVTEFSSIGLRVIVRETLPENIKLVEVLLVGQRTSPSYLADIEPLKMLVARRQGQVLGLCLFDELERISPNLGEKEDIEPQNYGLLVNSRA